MKNKDFWHKRFSVGLPLMITTDEFRACLETYHDYIDTVYLSSPMGDRFHAREQIAEQLKNRDKVELFWKLAEIIKDKKYDINLEIVFNTPKLIPGDIEESRELFDQHDIKVDKVAVLDSIDWYYDSAKEYFPEAKIVQSVNNMKNTPEGLKTYKHKYDEIILGRQLIRNTEAARTVKELGSKCVLLLNNGCSFICGGCREKAYCKRMYDKARESHSAEYLYAQQSIMPFELHDDYFPLQYYDYFKLATRNGDADYINKTLDSYINNKTEEYLDQGIRHYSLWGKLAWHIPHNEEFDLDRIREIKKQICNYSGG